MALFVVPVLPVSILLTLGLLLYIFLFVGRRGRNFPDGKSALTLKPFGIVISKTRLLQWLTRSDFRPAHIASDRELTSNAQGKAVFPVSSLLQDYTDVFITYAEEHRFTEWAKKYGGMYTLKLGTATAVVLTDRRIIKQLLEKRSSISSNRPRNEVGQKIGEGDHLLLMDNTPTWRLMRKQIHQDLTESMCDSSHSKIQHAETVQMLHDMLQAPEHWVNHLKRFSNSVVMSIVYGIRSPTIDAPHTKKLSELVEIWARINEFGATPPVDIFPFLKIIPERFLGNWKVRTAKVHDAMHELYNDLLKTIIKRRESMGSLGSVIDRLLDQQEKTGLTTHQITLLAGVTTKGGSDTSASVLTSCVQALVTCPEVQKKAQAEIDAVIGEDRIPSWSDYEQLPYVAAIVKESMRWRPVAPLSVPHALSEDEWVDGKFLPKGTVCLLNVWGLHHDESKFPNSNVFDPDHYKDRTLPAAEYANSADYENRDHYGYGNGRRVCPGIHLADRGLFQAISKMLWAFRIETVTDPATGKPVVPDTDMLTGYREGLTACAYDFPCRFTVRSQARRDTIMRELVEARENVFPKYETAQFS